jgi:hypothetical protein
MLDLLEKAITEKYERVRSRESGDSEVPSQKRSRSATTLRSSSTSEAKGAAIPFIRFDGSMSQEKRAAAIQNFQEDPRIRILFISLKSLATSSSTLC